MSQLIHDQLFFRTGHVREEVDHPQEQKGPEKRVREGEVGREGEWKA